MEVVKRITPTVQHYLTIAFSVFFACITLFLIDKDTQALTDLFKPGNLVAFIVYFSPSFVISVLLFRYFSKKFNKSDSLFLSLLIGIPLSFLLVIFLLLNLFS